MLKSPDMKKPLLLLLLTFLLSGCTTLVELKGAKVDLDALHRASSTVNQLNGKINELNKEIRQ